jgi:hypothetical protein
MRPIQLLRRLLESHGIYDEAIKLMRQCVTESVIRFEEGHYYKTVFRDGETIYLLAGPSLRGGGNRAIKIEDYRPIATSYTTTFLTPTQWDEINEQDVPPKLLAKVKAKALAMFGNAPMRYVPRQL